MIIRSLLLAGSREPRTFSFPIAFAALTVGKRTISLAGRNVGSLFNALWTLAVILNSSIIERLLLLATPSVPVVMLICFARHFFRGRNPEASLRLLSVLMEMLTFRSARISMSLSESQTAWAAITSSPQKPRLSRYSVGVSL